jgi:hypothetical protein
VDDILIFRNKFNVIKEVKDFLTTLRWKTGEAAVILNIKLLREGNSGVTLIQFHYVEKLLNRFGYSECMPSTTPYDPSVPLRKNHRISWDQLRYL